METVRIGADGEKEGGKVDGVKVDAKKVCKGLRCHSDVFNEEPDCEHCEYDNANCGLEVPSDALALIRQQQERIKDLEDMCSDLNSKLDWYIETYEE